MWVGQKGGWAKIISVKNNSKKSEKEFLEPKSLTYHSKGQFKRRYNKLKWLRETFIRLRRPHRSMLSIHHSWIIHWYIPSFEDYQQIMPIENHPRNKVLILLPFGV